MYNPDTDLIFPPRVLPALVDLRDGSWHNLVLRVIGTRPESHEMMAFILMMARINNCATCNPDSYRSLNGCSTCSIQSIKRIHETDDVLVENYETASNDVDKYIQKKKSIFR